jgi:hypothetical protein
MIIQVPEFDPKTGQTGYVQGNFGHNYYYGIWASVSMLPIAKWWYQTFGIYAAYIKNEDKITTYSQQAFLHFNTTLLLSKTWSAEVTGWMQTPTVWGYYDVKAQGSLDIGIKKTFYNNQGSVSLYFDDIFKTQRSYVTMSREGTVSYAESRWSSRSIRFSLSWRFGSMSNPVRQRKVGQQEEVERMGSGDGGGGRQQ